MTAIKLSEIKAAVVDLETTGLTAEDCVVEAAVICLGYEGISGGFDSLFNPGIPIPAAASATHHIIDSDVAGLPEFHRGLIKEKKRDSNCYVAHNADFDTMFFDADLPVLCTMKIAKKLWPGLESYSNQFLRYHFKLQPPVDRRSGVHRSRPDAVVTAFIFQFELHELEKRGWKEIDLGKFAEWMNSPNLQDRISFGKHKGSMWSEVPRDYLKWIIDKAENPDADTLFTAQYYYDLANYRSSQDPFQKSLLD